MNKILLALALLGAGTAGALTARHSANKIQREASATHESWMVQSRILAATQGERDRLAERIRELGQSLRQAEAAGTRNGLWSVLETNRIGHLTPVLREHLLEELGFNWHSPQAFIVVSKETLREIEMKTFYRGKLTDSAAAVLALTPRERSRVEAAMERVQADVRNWAISQTERIEPGGDVLVRYALQSASLASITNHFTEAFTAIGKERTELMTGGNWPDLAYGSVQDWMRGIGMSDKPVTMTLKHVLDGNKLILKFQREDGGPWEKISKRNFPNAFRPLFPNGWADVAEREGFELAKDAGLK